MDRNEFAVLNVLRHGQVAPQRDIAAACGLSVGTVNRTCRTLAQKGLAAAVQSGGMTVTEEGLASLEPYRVENAVIMAAGLSSRFAPISYEKPKGLLVVKGEVLIERQIRQLHEAGITDITVVVGYKKEHFFYLEDKFGVKIVVNAEYASRNNNSSLMVVRRSLGSTYICSSDDYFSVNPFEPYVYRAYYASVRVEGPTDEWCIKPGRGGRIESVAVGGADAQIMLGQVYFDRAFSKRFVEILEAEYNRPETAGKLWEAIYVDHIKELDMYVRPYPEGVIHEFDSLDELREFDPYFLRNVDSDIFTNIASVLGCDLDSVHDVYPLKQGLTNLSCHFAVGDEEYVYRHPGAGTEHLVNRAAEMAAQSVGHDLGLDDTFIYEDPAVGWKISRFIPDVRTLDPSDPAQIRQAMDMVRTLHESGASVERSFDFFDESCRYLDLIGELKGEVEIPGFADMAAKIARLKAFASQDGAETCLSHNDFFELNLLLDRQGKMYLIDWEYAGMSDYASDFGTFTVCCRLDRSQAEEALGFYLGHLPTESERKHCFAYVALAGWCWYVWSLFKEAQGGHVGEWPYVYYRYVVEYLDLVLGWYEGGLSD